MAEPNALWQLASQQSISSAVYRAWRQRCGVHTPARQVCNLLNRPREAAATLLTVDTNEDISACALSHDGSQVAVGSKLGRIRLYDLNAAGNVLWCVHHEPENPDTVGDVVTDRRESIEALRWYTDARSGVEHLASAADICVRLWVGESGTAAGVLSGHVYTTTPGTGSGDPGIGRRPATGPCACRHYLLDGKNKKERSGICLEAGHSGTISDVAASMCGTLLASGGSDMLVKLWSTATCDELHVMHGHRAEITCLALSPDATRLYAGALHAAAAACCKRLLCAAVQPSAAMCGSPAVCSHVRQSSTHIHPPANARGAQTHNH